MPLYEYYCEPCNGVFETLRTMREAAEPAPCPLCDRDGTRIMPTTFSAFVFRDGLPRAIPDKGLYWHWTGQQTKGPNMGGVPMNEHSELYRPTPPPTKSRGDRDEERDVNYYKNRHLTRLKTESDRPNDFSYGADGKPALNPKLGM